MSIFRAIGLGILIITLKLLVPDIVAEGEQTAISFLRGARISADTASSIAASASLTPLAGTTPPLLLPSAPTPLIVP